MIEIKKKVKNTICSHKLDIFVLTKRESSEISINIVFEVFVVMLHCELNFRSESEGNKIECIQEMKNISLYLTCLGMV